MAYYDFPAIGGLRPYAGLGIGVVDIDLDVGTRATMNDGPVSRFAIIDGSDTVVGYRGTVGLAYDVGAADLTLGYTYTFTDRPSIAGRGTHVAFDFDRKLNTHAVSAGLVYRF
jgi:opacity protein-like surface antigen